MTTENFEDKAKKELWVNKYRRASRCVPHYDYEDFEQDIEGTFELAFKKLDIAGQDLWETIKNEFL